MKKCIINGKVILHDGIVEKNVYIEDGIISEISNREPKEEEIIDIKGDYLSPGFIEMHSHGRGGSDSMYATLKDLNIITSNTIKTGVTSLLPTTMTMGKDETKKAIQNIADNKDKVEGSKIIGIHMEGPFINAKHKGAQPEEYILEPSIDDFEYMVNNHTSLIKKITIAPEMGDSATFINEMTKRKIVVSIGHTDASYEEAMKSFKDGITSGTHTYNAMTGLNHRSPGCVGAIMDNNEVFAELILDGIHVSFPAARILLRNKGLDHLCLITDSMEAASLEDGKYQLGGQDVYVKDNSARLADGTLAGSVLSMNRAVLNAFQNLGITLNEAVNLASYNPAKCLHLNNVGEIAVNKLADLVVLDRDLNVKEVYIEGMRKI